MSWSRPAPSLFIFTSEGITSKGHIAGFDLDWTLTRTIRGKFPRDIEDITVLPNRIRVLKDLVDRGFTIVIFTNQKSTNDAKIEFNFQRVHYGISMLLRAGIPLIAMMAVKDDQYRKPNTGMWDTLKQVIQGKIHSAFYCGDAAGRPQDFSDSDRKYAENIGAKFYLPEELFPRVERINGDGANSNENKNEIELPESKSMVVLMGMPGAGKTTYYRQHLQPKGYLHVSRDELKTIPKMKKAVREGLMRGQLVAVDATNARQVHRQEYYQLAQEYGYTITLLYFVGDGSGFNKLRGDNKVPGQISSDRGSSSTLKSTRVPPVAYGTYYKYLEEPTPENTPGKLFQIM